MSAFDWLVVKLLPIVPKFVVRRVARRYVAGETIETAIETVRTLNDDKARATVDLLGEHVTEPKRARAVADEYVKAIEAIEKTGVDSNLSIKPTHLGLQIDEDLCLENMDKIFASAKERDNFVRIDMEDHTCTDATIRCYQAMNKRYGNAGIVLQSCLRRTLGDIDQIAGLGQGAGSRANVRLCKGIYVEPREIAWEDFDTVRANFVHSLEKMIKAGVYIGIATHDEHLVWAAMALIDEHKLDPDRYEFQMLLGVDPQLRKIIVDLGHRLRVYIPYGREWYEYSIRRLRENPKIARYVIRALFGLR